MKFSLKSIAAAVALAAVASTSFAAIDNGSNGNGELFFNIWDATGSYSRDLNIAIDSYSAATPLMFSADDAYTSFLSGVADTSALKWNIVAVDTQGAQRLLSTATTVPATGSKNSNVRSADVNVAAQANAINAAILLASATDSVAVGSASAAWAGKTAFGANPGALLNFTNAGTLANDSFANGLSFIQVDALATGIAASKYTAFSSKAWIGTDGSINIAAAAVPEPENYAMLLAGLGMIGFMARGKKRA